MRFGRLVGGVAFVLSIGLALLYMPGSPSALLWPSEWAIFIAWSLLGAVMYLLGTKNRVD